MYPLKSFFIGVLLLSATYAPLFAQAFLPGTVVLQSGKQETGSISVNRWGTTAQQIQFKDRSGRITTYGKRDLQSFEVTRKDQKTERYACKIVKINRSPYELSELEPGPAPRMEADTLILQLLLESDFTLYGYMEHKVRHVFLEKDSITELIYKRFLPNEQISTRFSENNRFRQQLLTFTQSCASLQHRIQKMRYNEPDIQQLLIDYSACQNAPIRFKNEHERVKPYFDLIVGLAQTHTHISTPSIRDYASQKLKTGFTPIIGLRFALPIPASRGGLWFVNDFSWWRLQTDGYVEGISNYDPKNFTVEINSSAIRWQPAVRWYVLRKPEIFAELGFEYARLLGFKGAEIRKANPYQPEARYSLDGKAPKSHYGWCAGIGYRYKRLTISGRYDLTRGMDPEFTFGNAGMPTSTFSLLVGCSITK